MKIKTSELIGPALDWAVAKCEEKHGRDNAATWLRDYLIGFSTHYSSVWSQGGPIIEEEEIQWCKLNGQIEAWSRFDYIKWGQNWDNPSRMVEGSGFGTGPTILIAAMRCYAVSKLGNEVEVPVELSKG